MTTAFYSVNCLLMFIPAAPFLSLIFALSLSDLQTANRESDYPTEPGRHGIHTKQTGKMIKITIGKVVFKATLQANSTAEAFKAMLPLTVPMKELNGNEKFFYFSSVLPTDPVRGGGIQSGDLMLYGNNCLVVFYEPFNTTYQYTRIGKIENSSGLKSALGAGDVTVKFEVE